jgi:hypothetical protein
MPAVAGLVPLRTTVLASANLIVPGQIVSGLVIGRFDFIRFIDIVHLDIHYV